MRLLIVRHAVAKELDNPTEAEDANRELTAGGRRKMQRIAKRLVRLVGRINVLVCSPLPRATQTADIIATASPNLQLTISDTLVPGADPEAFLDWLRQVSEAELVAVVGHEPHLGSLVTWLLCDRKESRIELKKGGACLLEFEGEVQSGAGRLRWLLTSRQLRRMDA